MMSPAAATARVVLPLDRAAHPMLAALVEIRAEYVSRFPRIATDGWTVGHVHAFSTVVLGVVELHPNLASLSRVADDVRIATHRMLFPSEEPLAPDTVMTPSELYRYVERNSSSFSGSLLCAAPKAFINDVFRALFDGDCSESAGPLGESEENLFPDLATAVDHGLLCLRLDATTFSLWIEMAQAYEQLSKIVRPPAGIPSERFEQLQSRVDEEVSLVRRGSLWSEADRAMHDRSFGYMREQSARGLGPSVTIDTGIDSTVRDPNMLRTVEVALAGIDWLPGDRKPALAKVLASFINDAQNTLRRANVLTRSINDVLGRPQPTRPLTDTDLTGNQRLRSDKIGGLPYLLDTIADELGLRLSTTAADLTITVRR